MNNQAYLFLIFSLNGFIIGVLFDFFRILRKSFKTKDIITYSNIHRRYTFLDTDWYNYIIYYICI